MTLELISDGRPAQWLDLDEGAWVKTVTFGPSGFEAYGRVMLMPDPDFSGQPLSSLEYDDDMPHESEPIRLVIETLTAYTTTPKDAYFCLWDGLDIEGSRREQWDGSFVEYAPAFPERYINNPAVCGYARSYLLFRGPLADLEHWGAANPRPGIERGYLPAAFIWPADQSWCFTNEIDSHWAGVGGSREAIDHLTSLVFPEVLPARRDMDYPDYG